MSPILKQLGIDRMSYEEKMDLIDEILCSVDFPKDIPAWHLELIEERLAHSEAHPEDRIPWKKALEDIRNDQ